MITQIPKPAMIPVKQPAPFLRAAYWTKVEDDLLAELSRLATAQQKEVAL